MYRSGRIRVTRYNNNKPAPASPSHTYIGLTRDCNSNLHIRLECR